MATKNSKTPANNPVQSPAPPALNRQQAETFEKAMQLFHQRDFRRALPLFEQAGEWAEKRFIPNDVVHVDWAGNRFVSEAAAKLVRKMTGIVE